MSCTAGAPPIRLERFTLPTLWVRGTNFKTEGMDQQNVLLSKFYHGPIGPVLSDLWNCHFQISIILGYNKNLLLDLTQLTVQLSSKTIDCMLAGQSVLCHTINCFADTAPQAPSLCQQATERLVSLLIRKCVCHGWIGPICQNRCAQ